MPEGFNSVVGVSILCNYIHIATGATAQLNGDNEIEDIRKAKLSKHAHFPLLTRVINHLVALCQSMVLQLNPLI
jgi:hypothetical protein